MDVSIGNPGVRALLVRTGEALGLDPLGYSSAAFHLTPGTYWRRRRRFHHRRVGAAEAAVGAVKWGAWLEKAVDQRSSPACL